MFLSKRKLQKQVNAQWKAFKDYMEKHNRLTKKVLKVDVMQDVIIKKHNSLVDDVAKLAYKAPAKKKTTKAGKK